MRPPGSRSSRCSSPNSDLIRTFGEAGLIATVIALVAVLTLVPVFGVLLVRNETALRARRFKTADAGVHALRRFCAWIAVRMVGTARPLQPDRCWSSSAASAVVYANLQPRYRLADQVPDKQQAVAASGRLDAKLTGANPIDVLIEFPKGASLYSPETLATIADVHALVEKQAGVGNVWSLETLRRWLAEKAGKSRCRDAEGICRAAAGASGAPLHLRPTRMRWSCPAAFRIATPASFCPVVEKLDQRYSMRSGQRIPATRSR